MNDLSLPYEDNYYRLEEYKLAQSNDLDSHVKKFAWLHSRYGSPNTYSVEDARERQSKMDTKKVVGEYKNSKKYILSAIKRARKLAGDRSNLVDLLQFIVYYRTQRTDVFNRATYDAIPMLEKKAQTIGLTYEQLLYCLWKEISDRSFRKPIIQSRMKRYAVLLEDGKTRYLEGNDVEEWARYFQEKKETVDQFTGTSACRGKINGIVRIILDRNDFYKLSEGEIIVTPMTTPEFIPIMRKASAFVTDEGGVTCHAAIVAREMGKPCVIGTKIATQILKDGDMIEVDATKGVVKILNQVKSE